MTKRKNIRFFRFAEMAIMIILATGILLICFTTLRNNVSTSKDVASEMQPVPVSGTKSTVTNGSGHKPTINQVWSRSEVFMY